MAAIPIESAAFAQSFMELMSKPHGAFDVDLSTATLEQVIDKYIEFKTHTRPKFANSWHTTRKYLKALEFIAHRPIMPIDVSETFYPYLIQYMLGHGLATSSVEHTLHQIHAALEFASRYGARLSPTYDRVDFRGRTKEKTILTYAELCHVYYFDVRTLKRSSGKPYRKDWYEVTEKVRDMFIFSTIFGQRHSDIVRITRENFDGDTFTITQQKTGNRVTFDYKTYAFDKKIARELLQKYDFTAPYTRDLSNYNGRLQELIKGIGGEFNEEVVTEEKILGRIVRKTRPRYKAIGSHTARRTAISYWANLGKAPQWIRKMSGHTGLESLCTYMLDEAK